MIVMTMSMSMSIIMTVTMTSMMTTVYLILSTIVVVVVAVVHCVLIEQIVATISVAVVVDILRAEKYFIQYYLSPENYLTPVVAVLTLLYVVQVNEQLGDVNTSEYVLGVAETMMK